MNYLGNNIRFIRRVLFCKTQLKLSESLNLSRSAIDAYEAGRNEPNINTLIKLKEISGYSIDEIITEDLETKNRIAKGF